MQKSRNDANPDIGYARRYRHIFMHSVAQSAKRSYRIRPYPVPKEACMVLDVVGGFKRLAEGKASKQGMNVTYRKDEA